MQKKSYLFILMAAALWGCLGVFLNLLTAAGLTSMQSVAVRTGTATVLYFVYLWVTDRKALNINPRDCRYFIGTGILSVVFFNWCYFNTIQLSSLSVAAVLLYTSPAFVMLLSALLFHEPVTRRKLAALLLTFLGCTLVTGLLPLGGGISPKTLLFGLGAGFGYALYTIFSKFALEKYAPGTVSFYTFLFATLAALPMSGLLGELHLLLSWNGVMGGLGMGIFCCILPYVFYTEGLRHAEAGKAAILATAEPFVAALLGIVFFHEVLTPFKLLGMAAILFSIVLLNSKSSQ